MQQPTFTTRIKPTLIWSALREIRDREIEVELGELKELLCMMQTYHEFQVRPEPDQHNPKVPTDRWPTLIEYDRCYVTKVVESTKTFSEAAKVLGINESTLWRRRNRKMKMIKL